MSVVQKECSITNLIDRAKYYYFNLKILLIATQCFTLSKRSSDDTTLNSLLAQLIQRFADAIASCARAFKILRAK